MTHLIIKPADAGLVSSLVIETDRRTYAIKLVSTQHEWMPLVAFNYPDDMQRQWSAYQQTVAFGAAASRLPTGENVANLDFGFRLSGDDPRWRPLRVYTRRGEDLHPVPAHAQLRHGAGAGRSRQRRRLVLQPQRSRW